MTLPPSQQHALDAIDDVLQSAEPRLATMFGVFTDLTRLEKMPAAETLPPRRWWARYQPPGCRYRPGRRGRRGRPPGRQAGRKLGRIVLVPLLLLAAAALLIVSLVSSGAAGRRGCGQSVAAVMSSRLRSATDSRAVTDSGVYGGTGCPTRSAPQPAAGAG